MQELQVRIISQNTMQVSEQAELTGWGGEARAINLIGQIREFSVELDGKPQFVLFLRDDGSLILNGMDSRYSQYVRSINLQNTRPWKEAKPKRKPAKPRKASR